MHEISIVVEILEQVESQAKANNFIKVYEVMLEVGFLKQVVPDLMQVAFESATIGTIAEGAKLNVMEVPAVVECKDCLYKFQPKIDDFLCPKCDKANINIIEGNDIILKSISGDIKEE